MERITTASAVIAIIILVGAIILAGDEDCDGCYDAPMMAAKLVASGIVIMGGALLFRTKYAAMESIAFRIDRQPVLKTNKATDGVAFACKGEVKTDSAPLRSEFTNTPCVYYHSILEKLESDGEHSSWVIKYNKASFIPFYVQDNKSRLKVDINNMDGDFSGYAIMPLHMPDPKNSEIDCDAILKRVEFTEHKNGGLLDRIGIRVGGRFRKSEYVLKPDTKVFVYGMVGKTNNENVIREAEGVPLIISKKDKEEYINEFFKGSSILYASHLLMAAGFTIALASADYFIGMGETALAPILLIGNSAIIGSIIFTMYNRIVSLRQRALNSLSNIEIELKRRSDLIPRIVDLVKEYARYEKEVNLIIAEARVGMMFSKQMRKGESPVLASLAVSIEHYPKLMAGEPFRRLMDELVDTEERIAYSREFYNRSVLKYNTLIIGFPFLLIATPFGMKEMEYISITRGNKA